MRTDPWSEHRFRDTLELGNQRAFIPEGSDSIVSFSSFGEIVGEGDACLVFEARGDLSKVQLTFLSQSNETSHTSTYSAGWHSLCFDRQSIESATQLEIDWSDDGSGSRWLNPLGLSGRGDTLLDSTGLSLHWFEIKHYGSD
tara:strand:- start:292 stop:717 length:426 start_codon:yes stop_codon:yes gene_type:complete